MRKIISLMLAAALILSCISLPVYADDENGAPFEFINYSRQLKVSGNKIVYADQPDTAVTLRGVNVPSMGWGMQEHLYESLVETYDSWNGNLIRLPISASYWFGDQDPDTGEYTGTYEKSGVTYKVSDYRAAVDAMVRGAAARGKYILIDNHGYVLPIQKHLDMLLELCELYGNNPAVLFGILNEPNGKSWDQWYYGDPENDYLGHQYMVEQIRDAGAKNILVVGGLSYAYNIGGILGTRDEATGATYELTDCGTNSDTSKTGYGIMYDTHIYPVKGSYSSWESTIGEMRLKYPILCGEWGWDSNDDTITGNSSNTAKYWEQQLMNWMDDVEGKYGGVPMNWTAWNMHMSSTPRMITGWNFMPNSYHGRYVKERLLSYPSSSLLRDETITADFENTTFRSYSKSNTVNTVENGKLTIAYDFVPEEGQEAPASFDYYSRLVLPIEWDMNGLQTLKLTIKGPAGESADIGFYGTDQEIYTKNIIFTGDVQEVSINVDEFEFDPECTKIDGELTPAINAVYIGGTASEGGSIEVTKVSFVKSANPVIEPVKLPPVPDQEVFFDMEDGEDTFSSYYVGKGATSADTFDYSYENVEGYDGNPTTALKISYTYSGSWSGHADFTFPDGVVPAGTKYLSLMIKGTGDTAQRIQINIDGQSFYPEIAVGENGWHQYIFDITESVSDPSRIDQIKFYAKNKVTDSFLVDNISFTIDEPERLIPIKESETKVLAYTFERSISYKHDIALQTEEGGEGDSIAQQVVNEGCASPRADYITYTRGSSYPATAILNYNNGYDFFKSGSGRTTWTEDMKYCEDLVFDAKSVSGKPEKIKIALYDACSILSDYKEFTLTDEWQRYRIPVSEFTDPISGYPMRAAIIRAYYIQSAEENTSGGFLIDNITLTNDEDLAPAEDSLFEYVNNFDGADLFTQNGGGWASDTTAESPDEDGHYFYAEYEPHSGLNGGGAMHFYNNLGGSSNKVKVTGIPDDWDLSKPLYVGAMIKSSDMTNSAKKVPYSGTLVVQLYNGTTLAATANMMYSAGGWNWSEAPLTLSSKLKENFNEVLAGCDMIAIYPSSSNIKNDFYIDDLTFSYTPLKAEKIIDYPISYNESFSITGMSISSAWDKASSGEGFIKNVDNAGLVGDNGASIQFVYTDEMIDSGNAYVYWDTRDFWDISRTEYFGFAASLMTDSSRKSRWKTKNINTYYPYSDDYCNETLGVTFALVDALGKEYRAPAVTLSGYDTAYYKVPVEGFVDENGNAPDFSKITQMRMYPDTSVTGGCFWFDEIGFKTDKQYIADVESGFITEGIHTQNNTVTVTFKNNGGTAETHTIIAAVYNKDNMSLYDVKYLTGTIDSENLSLSVPSISVPEDKDNYMVKIFVWDGSIEDMNSHDGSMMLPITVDY